jgi:condensin complex subunit 3
VRPRLRHSAFSTSTIAQEDKVNRQPEVPTNSISSGSTDDDDTVASVFVSSILEWVTQGFIAKNKVVRYQAVHLVAEMISFLGEVECVSVC